MEIRDTRNGEWFWVNTAINACPHITHAEKCVYGALASFSGCKEIHPSFEIIAKKSNTTSRMAMKAVKNMEKVDLIKIEKGGGRGNANVYFLLKRPKGCKLCAVSINSEQKNTVSECKETVNKKTLNCEQNSTAIDKEVDKEIDNTSSKEEGAKAIISYGNENINICLEELKKVLGGSPDGSIQQNRRFCHLLIGKFKKDYPDKEPTKLICDLIKYGLQDEFHAKNMTNFKYLYYNSQKIIQSIKGRIKNKGLIV